MNPATRIRETNIDHPSYWYEYELTHIANITTGNVIVFADLFDIVDHVDFEACPSVIATVFVTRLNLNARMFFHCGKDSWHKVVRLSSHPIRACNVDMFKTRKGADDHV